jgi:hypothetical protein
MASPGPQPDPKVAAMIRMYRDGYSLGQIGNRFGISKSSVDKTLARAERRGEVTRRRGEPVARPKPRLALPRRKLSLADFMDHPVTAPDRRWCNQCERNVLIAEAAACGRPFCKAKERAA